MDVVRRASATPRTVRANCARLLDHQVPGWRGHTVATAAMSLRSAGIDVPGRGSSRRIAARNRLTPMVDPGGASISSIPPPGLLLGRGRGPPPSAQLGPRSDFRAGNWRNRRIGDRPCRARSPERRSRSGTTTPPTCGHRAAGRSGAAPGTAPLPAAPRVPPLSSEVTCGTAAMGVAMPRPRVPRRRTLRGTGGPARGGSGALPLGGAVPTRRRRNRRNRRGDRRTQKPVVASSDARRVRRVRRVSCGLLFRGRAGFAGGQVAGRKISGAESTQSSRPTLGDAGHRLSRVRFATTATGTLRQRGCHDPRGPRRSKIRDAPATTRGPRCAAAAHGCAVSDPRPVRALGINRPSAAASGPRAGASSRRSGTRAPPE